mgnify:CR=1 FL=1|tara:strand:- start:4231 stop:4554 length:324 start_codon:yes stop_codon:yes gene_type:complete
MEYDPAKPHLINGDHVVVTLSVDALHRLQSEDCLLFHNDRWVGTIVFSWKGYMCMVLNAWAVSIIAIYRRRDHSYLGHIVLSGNSGALADNIPVDRSYICNRRNERW